MTVKPKQTGTQSRVDFVVETIRNGIRNGDYVPGQRLIESDLTKEFGISRGPFREAMSRLAGDGLVVMEPHKGVAIRKMSRQNLQELYEVRTVVESLAARLAANKIDQDKHRKRLEKLMESMRALKDSSDVMGYTALNDEFHGLIVAMSGNRYLMELVNHLRVPIFRYQFHRFMDGSAKSQSIADHEAIAAAILKGDGPGAERAMRRHIVHSGKLTRQLAG
ncbi:MAG: GntR family transcriptional regulator [Haliea sp.]|uniref:GntR family transcriptional regulator n=1 Tax=Marinobacter salarius TaxID=1420917 RepID=UPI0032ECCE0E